MSDASRDARLGRTLGMAMLLATLLNGIGPFAKRVGLVERAAFERYWSQRCGPQGSEGVWLGFGRRCGVSDEESPLEWYRRGTPYARYLLEVRPAERPLKAAKDVVSLSILAMGLAMAIRGGGRGAFRPTTGVLWALMGVAAVAAVVGASQGAPRSLIAGARSLVLLPIALAWAPTISLGTLQGVARCCPALLASQIPFVAWELFYSSGTPTRWLPTRAAGTLVHPNTLGSFAVVVLAFGLSFSPSRRAALALWPLSLFLIFCSGSGSGWLVAGLLSLLTLIGLLRLSAAVRVGIVATLVLLSIPTLPILTGRPDVLDSALEGRVSAFRRLVTSDRLSLVFGEGLGAGTNTVITQIGHGTPADSTVTLMTRQTGLLGVGLLYAALVVAWWRRPEARLFLAAFAVASLSLNIVEAFPLNVLMGLTLALGLGPR